jgi:DNA-binding transcriptional regulator YhcF (GntR family)
MAGKKKPRRHVRLYHYLLQTAAWQDLDANARAIYVEIAQRYAGEGSNNGRIPYAVRDGAKALQISPATVSRALRSLIEHGFIVPMKLGGFNRKLRHATEWRLTEFPCDVTNAFASKEFARWSSEIQNAVSVTKLKVSGAERCGASGETAVA